MIQKFNIFLKESVLSKEEMDELYNDNDNAELFNYDNIPQNDDKHYIKKDNSKNAIYTIELLKSRLIMVKIYPEYYNFIDKIIKRMIKNGWEKINVPNNIDVKLSNVNGVGKMSDSHRMTFFNQLKNTTLKGITEA